MTDQTLEKVKIELRGLSDHKLDTVFIAVLDEIRRRKPKYKRLQRPFESLWKKDGEPIHGE